MLQRGDAPGDCGADERATMNRVAGAATGGETGSTDEVLFCSSAARSGGGERIPSHGGIGFHGGPGAGAI